MAARRPLLVSLELPVALVAALLVGWTSAACAAPRTCQQLPAEPSRTDGNPTTITMINAGPSPVYIRWINFQGGETSYTLLAPGQSYQQPTFKGHVWIGRDERSRCLSAFISEAANEAWTIDSRLAVDRPYETIEVEGFTIRVSPEWAERDPALKERCLKILANSLARLAKVVPVPAWLKLKQVPIWLDYEDVQFINGAYHPSPFWLVGHGMDPGRAKSVQFTRNLAALIDTQPNLVLHELAHAYHDLVLGAGDPSIRAAYQRALESGLYDSVERKGGGRERAYALTSYREFFAELSEAYFGENDFFPFNREQLQAFDPESFKIIAEAWDRP
jgi:von Hippel-Lindau disease tumor suppressor protein